MQWLTSPRYAARRHEPGVRQERQLTQSRWLAALKAGRTFATNGPLLEFSLGGKELGDEVVLPSAGGELPLESRYTPTSRSITWK